MALDDARGSDSLHRPEVLARCGPAVVRQCSCCAAVTVELGPFSVRLEPAALRQLHTALVRALVTMRDGPAPTVFGKQGQA